MQAIFGLKVPEQERFW